MSKQEIRELLEKARRSLHAAERLSQDGDYDFSVSRAYYAMFYGAWAPPLTRDIRQSTHSGVIAAFNQQFVQTGNRPTMRRHYGRRIAAH